MATRNGSSHPDSLIVRSDQTAPAAILVAQATSPASPPQGVDAPPSAAPQTVAFALGNDGAARLPVGTDLGNPRQDGANLEFVQPDGSVIIIVGGAISGLIVFIGEVEIPAMTVAAMFSANGIETAAGPDTGPDDGSARFARLGPQATDLEPHNPGSDKSGQSALLGNTELQIGRDDNGQADNWQPNDPNEHGDAPPVIDADDAGGAPDSADAASASEQTDEDIPFTGSAVGLVLPDADGLAVTGSYAMASDPLHGSITLNADTGAYTYTPAKDYSGADSFSFAVVDGLGNASAPATVRIDIAPIADGAVITVPVIYPVPSGDNSVVNTDVSSNPRNPSVAAIDGGYVVTWSSYGQDGSDSGVYAQRYSSDGTRQGD
ncbi:MAG: cadherin-like domain-containing protein [Devosia sp.]